MSVSPGRGMVEMRPANLLWEVLGAAALAAAGVRWLRVAQREHYLPGSVFALCRLWRRSGVLNRILAVVPSLAVIGWLAFPGRGWWEGAWPAAAILACVWYPAGLSWRGRTSPLRWTARLRRLAAITGAFTLAASLGAAALAAAVTSRSGLWGALAPWGTALLVPMTDLALWAAAPLERRLTRKYVRRARAVLRRVSPVVVGITGSYGKTSTKGYVRELAEGERRVVASPASFNNRLGLARAVNDHLTPDAEVFVAEMGTYGPGEISELCAWIPPRIAVITAIGPVHLQRFRTVERIVRAKAEITGPAQVVILNVDHPELAELADRLSAGADGKTVCRCGTGEGAADVRVRPADGKLVIEAAGRAAGEAPAAGLFAANLACAVAVALELGVPLERAAERAGRLRGVEHRQSVTRSEAGFEIIDDTFNSNPAGAARALKLLAGLGSPGGRRAVVTPGMVELGPRQHEENRRFAAAAAQAADHLVIVGSTNRRALRSGAEAGKAQVTSVPGREQAVRWVRSHLGPGDAVLYENDLPDHYP